MAKELSEAEVSDNKRAAAKKLADEGPGAAVRDGEIAALLRERHGYEVYGKDDRAAQVTEQLALRGYRDPRTEPPKGRRAKPQETAD